MVTGTRSLVLDVAITFEVTKSTLLESEREKTDKYIGFADTIKHIPRCPEGDQKVKWHKRNNKILDLLRDSRMRIKTLSELLAQRTLLHTVDLCKAFRNLTKRM